MQGAFLPQFVTTAGVGQLVGAHRSRAPQSRQGVRGGARSTDGREAPQEARRRRGEARRRRGEARRRLSLSCGSQVRRRAFHGAERG